MMTKLLKEVRPLVEKELEEANKNFPLFHSKHEAYAVIKEEVEETATNTEDVKNELCFLWSSIKANNNEFIKETFQDLKEDSIRTACEAIQTAAMAQKAIDSMKNYKE